jgi:glutathione S-transferase
VLIALYENDTPFAPNIVNLQNEAERNALLKLWPIGKFPVLEDHARDWSVSESSIIIEYLDQHYPGKTRLVPADLDLARQMRFRDRFFDLYIHLPMQKIVGDRLRPKDKKDLHGVAEARAQMATAWSSRRWRIKPGQPARRSPWPTARPRRRCSTPTRSCRSPRRIRTPPHICDA